MHTQPVTPAPGPAKIQAWSLWLNVCLGVLAVLAAGVYYRQALPRTAYPYDLDFIEDAMLLQAWRVAEHQPVYLPPNADFAPQVYMPLYTWLGGWLFRLTGPAFWPLRGLSLAATTVIALLLVTLGRRVGAGWAVAWAGAGLFLAGYRLNGGWYELARVDTLYVALALGGMTVAIFGRNPTRRLLLAGLLLALSTLTKQNALFLGLVLGVYLLWVEGGRAWRYWLLFLGLTGSVAAWQQLSTHGWFSYYVIHIAYASPVELGRVWASLRREFLGAMGILTLGWLGGSLFWLLRSDRRAHPWPLFIGAALFVSLSGRASVGGNLNNLIPGYAFLCLAPALVAADCRRLSARRQAWVLPALTVALVGQFALTLVNPMRGYTPAQFRPTPAMRAAGDALVARLRQVDGDVWVMLHPFYALLAGKAPGVHIQTLWHARERGELPLPDDLAARLHDRAYALIISDDTYYFERDPALLALLNATYQVVGTLPADESPPTLSGVRVRPKLIYAPRP